MDYKNEIATLNEKARKLISESDAIFAKFEGKTMPEDVDTQLQEKLGEVDRLKMQIDNLKRMQGNHTDFAEMDDLSAAPTGWRPATPKEGNEPIDEKSWMEVEVPTYHRHPILGLVQGKKTVRFHTPRRVLNVKDYDLAFEAYLRKGERRLGTNDYKTLSVGVDSAGGFLSPPEYHAELIRKIATMATVRMNARVVQTSRDIAQWPKLSYTTDDKYTSGVRVTWTGELPASSTEHRVTDPDFGIYNVPVNTAMASMPISRDLIEDAAFDVIGLSLDLLAEAFALGENDKFWNGSGAGVPKGILNSIAATSGSPNPDEIDFIPTLSASPTLEAKDITSVVYALPAQYERNAKLFFQKSTEEVIRELTTSNGDFIWPVYPQVGNFGVAPNEILGFPTVRDEFVDPIGADNFPIVFGDLQGYLIADRVGVAVERLTEVYAETNIHLLLARKRVGGMVVEPWRMKALKSVSST